MKQVLTAKQRALCSQRANEILQEMRPCWLAYITKLTRDVSSEPIDEVAFVRAIGAGSAPDALFWHANTLRSALTDGIMIIQIRRALRQVMNRAAYSIESALVAPMRTYLLDRVETAREEAGRWFSDSDIEAVLGAIGPMQILDDAERLCDLAEPQHVA